MQPTPHPILSALLTAMHRHGSTYVIAGDLLQENMHYRQLLLRSLILRRKLTPILADQPYVGVLLPNALAVMVTFVSLHMLGKIPCMLNFSSGEANILHACRIANVRTILTSRQFIERGKFEPLIESLQKHHTVVYLEDIRPTITLLDKLRGIVQSFFPRRALATALAQNPNTPAVILYTSGSEGTPKGVALSHANILANVAQVQERLTFTTHDILFNALPTFHSFGLTVGLIMPPLLGLKSFLYPSPVQYKQIPKAVKDSRATIMLGTDTFYQGYARYATPEHFKTVRLAVAGAEKLKNSTLRHWEQELGVHIYQGYGVTEASPVIAVNIPGDEKNGSVGRLFPGMEYKLEPIPGLEKGGRLSVKGPNIMLGYLDPKNPGTILPQPEWYDTGDIVDVDAQGFITILGRAKRFAKIGGEMVSLQAVEDLAHLANPESAHAALAVPDERKGEQIHLYTEDKNLNKDHLIQLAKTHGIAEIALPKQVLHMETIPRLGTGKIDYPALTKLHTQ